MHISDRHIVLPTLTVPQGMFCGFSTVHFGDMRKPERIKEFLSAFGVGTDSLIWQEQTHGTGIHVVGTNDRGSMIPGVDGLVARLEADTPLPMTLSVHTADCVPILLFDPVSRVVGAVHSGWRGTLGHIVTSCIAFMESLGATRTDIRVLIGPHIGSCCYDVKEERIAQFTREFGEDSQATVRRDSVWYLDLESAITWDCLHSGVLPTNIESDRSLCTKHTDRFYSFRKSGAPLVGELAGVIGFSA